MTGYVECNNALIREIINVTNPQTAMLYLIILSHRNTKDGSCFPSISLLAKEAGVGERTISDMLTNLYQHKFLSIDSGKSGLSNNYYFPREGFYKKIDDIYSRRRSKKFRAKNTVNEDSTYKIKTELEDDVFNDIEF